MKFKFLGAGSAFTNPATSGNYQSNMVITSDTGKNLLIDCGTQAHMAMHEQGLHAHEGDIDAVYISHLHADHIGGMEEFGFKTFFYPGIERSRLFGNENVLGDLWETLKGGMASLQNQTACLETYWDVTRVQPNGSFNWEGQCFDLVQVVHIVNDREFVPSYGLRFNVKGLKYFLTTDAQHAPNQIQDFYNSSDVIFQDCETLPKEYASGVHANYFELLNLNDETRAKMWLYHYQDGDKPDCVADGFKGWVEKGQEFILGENA